MSENVNNLNEKDLEAVSGGAYKYKGILHDNHTGSKTVLFKKVGKDQKHEDNQEFYGKLREAGANLQSQANMRFIASRMSDAFENDHSEVRIKIYPNGNLGIPGSRGYSWGNASSDDDDD